MFHENLKTMRKAKGYTQEELAIKLNVVRQTVSKWEKGLSVPDADALCKIADVLDTDVSTLLGEEIVEETDKSAVAQQLAKISEQMLHYRHNMYLLHIQQNIIFLRLYRIILFHLQQLIISKYFLHLLNTDFTLYSV